MLLLIPLLILLLLLLFPLFLAPASAHAALLLVVGVVRIVLVGLLAMGNAFTAAGALREEPELPKRPPQPALVARGGGEDSRPYCSSAFAKE